MKRKRMIKLLMSVGCDRNDAVKAANLCDGRISHAVLYYDLCYEFARALCELRRQSIIEGDHSGEPAGIVGSVYE
nr:MAG TPA: UBA-like domain protein [Bacteriophage sp.]